MNSILDPKEVSRAQVGPRELKPPTSREYAIQTVSHLRRMLESLKFDEEHVRRELTKIEQYRHWEVLGYATVEALFDAEFGERLSPIAKDRLEKVLGGRGGAREGAGRPRKGEHRDVQRDEENQPDNVRLNEYGNRSDYTLARLRRDRPDLAERVERGELSANAAAIEAGFRGRTINTVPLDPERAAQRLLRCFSEHDLQCIERTLAARHRP